MSNDGVGRESNGSGGGGMHRLKQVWFDFHKGRGESTYQAFRYLKQEEKAIYDKLFMYYFSCPMSGKRGQWINKERTPYKIVSTDFRELTLDQIHRVTLC